MTTQTLAPVSLARPAIPAPARATIVVNLRCPRCGATVWFDDDEWKCSMCARVLWQPAPPPAYELPAKGADPVDAFLAEGWTAETDGHVSAGELYTAYVDWCAAKNTDAVSRGAFARILAAHGFERFRTRHARYWRGLRRAG
jgi:ribosomal protein S27AE